jgi:hypothetical protein
LLLLQIKAIDEFYDIVKRSPDVEGFPYAQGWALFMTFPDIQTNSHIYLILAFGTQFIMNSNYESFVLRKAIPFVITYMHLLFFTIQCLALSSN